MLYIRGWDPSSHLQTIDKILGRKGRIPSGIVWGLSYDLSLDCFLGEVKSNAGFYGGQLGSRLEVYLALRASHLKIKAGIPPRIVSGTYKIVPANLEGIPCKKFLNLTQDPRLDLWDPTWDWRDLASCFYLGHKRQYVLRQFANNCICGLDVHFSLL